MKRLEKKILLLLLSIYSISCFSLEMATSQKILKVKEYKQKYTLSCEIAAASAILNFLGNEISEDQIFAVLPFEKTPLTRDDKGNLTWGNPYQGFVGDHNGVFFKTGYGVYAPALAKALQKLNLNVKAQESYTIEALYSKIDQNLPSIVWVPSQFPQNLKVKTWKTPSGESIPWIDEEHALVFNGYNKKKKWVYLMDVADGKQKHLPLPHFLKAWAYLKNQALTFE